MSYDPIKPRSAKQQMQLDRMKTLDALCNGIARDHSGQLTSVTFHVVWKLLTFMGEEGEAFPAMDTIAKAVGLHERTVRDHLDRTVEAGYLTKKRDGRLKTNVYRLNLPSLCQRAVGPGDYGRVSGSTAPVCPTINIIGEGTEDSLAPKLTGSVGQCHRVSDPKATGPADPTIYVEDNYLGEPRTKTLVRSPSGRSDECRSRNQIEALTLTIFDATHARGRERSRKSNIARALVKLARDGVDLEIAARGTIAAMHGPDAYNEDLGGHAAADKILRERRWEQWLEEHSLQGNGSAKTCVEDDYAALCD